MNQVCVLQLDTQFPRIPGDVACRETFVVDVRIVKIKKAFVKNIVLGIPSEKQFIKFEKEIKKSNEKLIITSCGFTYYWQERFNKLTQSNIISSSLCCLDHKRKIYKDKEILILTFDSVKLRRLISSNQKKPFEGYILGLKKDQHLYQIIINDGEYLYYDKVQKELNDFLKEFLVGKDIKLIILECTNIAPYKNAFRTFFQGEIVDVLSLAEQTLPGSVSSKFL